MLMESFGPRVETWPKTVPISQRVFGVEIAFPIKQRRPRGRFEVRRQVASLGALNGTSTPGN